MAGAGAHSRTHHCAELRPEHTGQAVTVAGWVDSYRNQGKGLIFVDLRDREGLTQVVFDREDSGEALCALADTLRIEDVVAIRGTVRMRAGGPNPRLATGEVEVVATGFDVLSKAENLPFHPTDPESLPGEEIRLKWRHLDLRRPRMQRILRMRHRVAQAMRRSLDAQGFLEIETPILCKSTPEGARDFLVPSRLQPGEFYALPQSPQIFKQILMVAGCDRYFQIARCFRDEDPRADRQAEFTQLDLEMSFVTVDDVIETVSTLFRDIWREALGVEVGDIPRMTWAEAMERYGIDRPDTRYGLELQDLSDLAAKTDFKVFTGAVETGGVVKAIRVPGGASAISRKILDGYTEFVKQFGAGGLPATKVENGAFATGVGRFLEPIADDLMARLGCEDGDLVVFGVGSHKVATRSLGELRIRLARDLGLVPKHGEQWNFLWIVDFPLVEWNEDESRWDSLHHPFTSPRLDQLDLLATDPGSVLSLGYDLVLNGSEIAGGSVRIHQREVQERVFSLLGLSDEEARMKFGFLLDALRHGAPPHGGIAVGLDRTIMHICDTENIRDVMAFPKTQTGADLMSGAPSGVDEKQLAELQIASTWTGDPA
jgi:aspartyl-tRNA synthetase